MPLQLWAIPLLLHDHSCIVKSDFISHHVTCAIHQYESTYVQNVTKTEWSHCIATRIPKNALCGQTCVGQQTLSLCCNSAGWASYFDLPISDGFDGCHSSHYHCHRSWDPQFLHSMVVGHAVSGEKTHHGKHVRSCYARCPDLSGWAFQVLQCWLKPSFVCYSNQTGLMCCLSLCWCKTLPLRLLACLAASLFVCLFVLSPLLSRICSQPSWMQLAEHCCRSASMAFKHKTSDSALSAYTMALLYYHIDARHLLQSCTLWIPAKLQCKEYVQPVNCQHLCHEPYQLFDTGQAWELVRQQGFKRLRAPQRRDSIPWHHRLLPGSLVWPFGADPDSPVHSRHCHCTDCGIFWQSAVHWQQIWQTVSHHFCKSINNGELLNYQWHLLAVSNPLIRSLGCSCGDLCRHHWLWNLPYYVDNSVAVFAELMARCAAICNYSNVGWGGHKQSVSYASVCLILLWWVRCCPFQGSRARTVWHVDNLCACSWDTDSSWVTVFATFMMSCATQV